MIDLQKARVNTAGAYICISGFYLFALGVRPHNGNIPVVRLGGHCEGNETGWQCAAREVWEESNLHIKPLPPQKTYLVDWEHMENDLEEIYWQSENEQEAAPMLVVAHHREGMTSLSLMYHVEADGQFQPSSEVKGLILLSQEEVHALCREPVSLEQFLRHGGRTLLKDTFDKKLILEPFAQLRLLSRILGLQAENKSLPKPSRI